MKGKMFYDEAIIAIDVGTTKICVLVARPIGPEKLEIIGIGKYPSDGLRKGLVVDIHKTVHSIKKAAEEAALMAGFPIESACVGISGSHIQSINSHGAIPIKRAIVSHEDIKNVLIAAQAIALPEGQQILHVLPQYFIIDGSEPIHDPYGMHGVRLEAQVHIITGSISHVQNLIHCCEQAHIKVTDIILEQLASALSVLSDDERHLGIGILDIGGGTSDLALYRHKSIVYTMVLPVAGNHFTNDIALGLRTTISDAERIKKEYGSVFQTDIIDAFVDAESVHGIVHKKVAQHELNTIVHARAQELYALINNELERHRLKPQIPAGLVLTGGGSLLKGMDGLASQVFNMPVRIGKPHANYGLLNSLDHPQYATGYGLLLQMLQKKDKDSFVFLDGPLFMRIVSRMKSWVSDFF